MKQILLLTFLILGAALVNAQENAKQYRDYEYNRNTNAYYKLHIEPQFQRRAKEICSLEGASLMVPTTEDVNQLHGMLKQFPDIGDFVHVASDDKTHESAEETPLLDLSESEETHMYYSGQCEVVTRSGELKTTECYYRHPFICKLEDKDRVYDPHCRVYSKDYKYYDNVKSCYRVPPIPLTWDEAYSECRHENAHLVVLNSVTESETVKEFLKTVPRHADAHTTYFFFAGIRANRPTDRTQRVFKTIFNETLEEAGFNVWSDGEPNNYMDSEYCGTVFSNNGKYNDAVCSDKYSFICEKEVTS